VIAFILLDLSSGYPKEGMIDVINGIDADEDIEEVSQQCPHCEFKTPFTKVYHKHMKWLHNTYRQQILANLQQQAGDGCVDAATIAMIATTTRIASRIAKRSTLNSNDGNKNSIIEPTASEKLVTNKSRENVDEHDIIQSITKVSNNDEKDKCENSNDTSTMCRSRYSEIDTLSDLPLFDPVDKDSNSCKEFQVPLNVLKGKSTSFTDIELPLIDHEDKSQSMDALDIPLADVENVTINSFDDMEIKEANKLESPLDIENEFSEQTKIITWKKAKISNQDDDQSLDEAYPSEKKCKRYDTEFKKCQNMEKEIDEQDSSSDNSIDDTCSSVIENDRNPDQTKKCIIM